MLFRLGKYEEFNGFRTYKRFEQISKALCERMIAHLVDFDNPEARGCSLFRWPRSASNDIFHLQLGADKIMVFLENINKIYKGRSQADIHASSFYTDGFSALCRKAMKDKRITKNFAKVCKENGLEIPAKSTHNTAPEQANVDECDYSTRMRFYNVSSAASNNTLRLRSSADG